MKPSEFARLAGITAKRGPATAAELERSAAYRAPGGKQCLEAIAAAWWSGTVPLPGGGQRVVTFSDALVWREVHEPMTCQGAVDSWTKPGRAAVA
jgi:Membrane bound FAD containing D-sorbitol dehydrogenase